MIVKDGMYVEMKQHSRLRMEEETEKLGLY